MNSATQRLVGTYVAVVMLQVPLAFAANALTDAVGGLIVGLLLLSGMIVDALFGIASDHYWLVWGLSFLIYLATFSMFVLPAHFAFRKREVAHAVALALVVLGFALVVAFAFPVHGVPV